MIGNAVVMGIMPVFWSMSLWEFSMAVDGWNRANSSEEDQKKLSDSEVVELSAWLDKRA